MNDGFPTYDCVNAPSFAWGNTNSSPKFGKVSASLAITAGVVLAISVIMTIPLCMGKGH